MAEYKGFYYGDDDDQNFYEGGAHFKYYQLYNALEKLYKEQQIKIRNEELLAKRKLKKNSNIKKENKDDSNNVIKQNNNVSLLFYNLYLI